jgi:hypothetical protein
MFAIGQDAPDATDAVGAIRPRAPHLYVIVAVPGTTSVPCRDLVSPGRTAPCQRQE